MSAPTPADKIQVASISDRGLSEKRPMNEDSFLADAGRGIYVTSLRFVFANCFRADGW